MHEEFWLVTPQVLGLLVFWVLGGISAILHLAYIERNRHGRSDVRGLLVIFEDIQVNPVPMCLGYTFTFVVSWLHFPFFYLSKPKRKNHDLA